jgi:hypothetical protein
MRFRLKIVAGIPRYELYDGQLAVIVNGPVRSSVESFLPFDYLELKLQLFSAENIAKILLPKLTQKSQVVALSIEIDQKFDAKCLPQSKKRNIAVNRTQLYLGIKIKYLATGKESIERVGIYVISMCRIVCPVWVRVMRCQQPDPAAWSGDPVQFGDKSYYVGNVLDNVIRNYKIELAVPKRIGNITEIVNNIRGRARVVIKADCALRLIRSASDVQNLFHL